MTVVLSTSGRIDWICRT